MVSTSKQPLRDLHADVSHTLTDEAHDDLEAAETKTYLTAYEQCTVPFQRRFNSAAELDAEIVQQLTHEHFPLTVEPNIQAKLDKLVQRIRNTWVKKYNITFGSGIQQNPGVLQPTSLTWKAPGYNDASSRGVKPGAVGDVSRASVPSISKPNTVPRGPANGAPSTLPQLDKFTFTAPGPDRQVRAGKKRQFAGNSDTPVQPLFANDHTKREKVKYLLELVPDESVAHCMEALWRCDDDLDDAREQLIQRQERQVIEIPDSASEEGDGGGPGRPKKKQKVDTAPVHVKSKRSTKREMQRLRKALGTLQRPSEKALSALRKSPEYTPFSNDGANSGLPAPRPGAYHAQPPTAPDYISIKDDGTTTIVRYKRSVHTPRQPLERPTEIIDLTIEADHVPELDHHATGPNNKPTTGSATRNALPRMFANDPIIGSPVTDVALNPDGAAGGLVAKKWKNLQSVAGAAHDECVNLENGIQCKSQQRTQQDTQQQQNDLHQPGDLNAGRTTANAMRDLVRSMRQASVSLQQSSQQEQEQCDNSTDSEDKTCETVNDYVPLADSTASMRVDNGKSKIVGKHCIRDHPAAPIFVSGSASEPRLRESLSPISRYLSATGLTQTDCLEAFSALAALAVPQANRQTTDGRKPDDNENSQKQVTARGSATTTPANVAGQPEKSAGSIKESQTMADQSYELEEGEVLEDDAAVGALGEQHTSNHQSDAALRTLADVRGSNPESVDFSLGTLYNSIKKAHQLDQAKDRA